jgi:hypothetical protein
MSLIETLHGILESHKDEPVYKRIRMRLREMGKNVSNEQAQFRVLQRACRESAELDAQLTEAGFAGVAMMNTIVPEPQTAALIQAFNGMVERYYEDW